MTSIELTKDNSKILDIKKSKSPKKDKKEMSYLEALDAIQQYDLEIKEVAKKRIENPIDADYIICNRSVAKTLFGGLGGFGIAIFGSTTGTLGMDGIIPVTIASTSLLGISLPVWSMARFAKLISPLQYKKLVEQETSEQRLVELKEQEFRTAEEVILKKAKKARRVIDATLLAQNKFSEYQDSRGREGFKISDITHLNEWEQEKLRAKNEQIALAGIPSKQGSSLDPAAIQKELTV
jgi:hypothetical protein